MRQLGQPDRPQASLENTLRASRLGGRLPSTLNIGIIPCAAIAYVDKSSLKSMESISGSTNAIAHFAEGRVVRYPMQPPSFRMENSGGFVALSSSHRGRKNQGSGLIFVPPAALRCPTHSGICRTSGFPLDYLKATVVWRSLPIYVWLPKPHGTPPLFMGLVMTSCQIFLSSSRFCRHRMPLKPLLLSANLLNSKRREVAWQFRTAGQGNRLRKCLRHMRKMSQAPVVFRWQKSDMGVA